jgi:hypothetical protein
MLQQRLFSVTCFNSVRVFHRTIEKHFFGTAKPPIKVAPAQKNLGLFYETGLGLTKDILQASEWYRKAAEQGNIDAQNHLKRLSALSGNS